MSVQVFFVGKLAAIKSSESFKDFEIKKYDSGWVDKVYRINLISGDNRFMMQLRDGCFEDQRNDVYTFSKSYVDENGKRVNGSSLVIPFKERLTSKHLPEVADFKKFVVELEEPGYRKELRTALEKLKEGKELTDEEVSKFGSTEKELKDALEKSNKKRKEFICQWDMIDFLKKVIDSGKYKDRKFYIKGEQEYQWSDKNGRWYTNYVPQKVYLQSDDAAEYANANLKLLFDKDSFEDLIEEKGECYVNGYQTVYVDKNNKDVPAPYTLVLKCPVVETEDGKYEIDESDEKAIKAFNIRKKRFIISEDENEKCEVYELGVVCDLLDGAQRRKLTEEDLTEEQQDALLCGDITMNEILRELGGYVYGDVERKSVFNKLMVGYSKGREETSYTSNDLKNPFAKNGEDVFEDEEAASDEDDLFSDSDDDDLFAD